jgi:hypothetical protein
LERTTVRRRDFLKTGAAATACATLPQVFFTPDSLSAQTPGPGQLLTAQTIWCSDSVEVPIAIKGHAAGIASNAGGHAPSSQAEQPCDLHAVFVREFQLAAKPAQATIQLFAYTRYRLYVNGVYCGRGPGRFQNQRPEYDTRQIAHALRPGKNVIAVLVHRDAPTGRIMRHAPGFAALLRIGEGSAAQRIATDTSWRACPELSFGPRNQAWASIEESIDARKRIDLTDPHLSAKEWPAAIPAGGPEFLAVWPATAPAQRETERTWSAAAAQLPLKLAAGEEADFDLPEIVQGYSLLEFDAEDGSVLETAYLLPEKHDSGKCSYTARPGVQTWMGGDTFAFNRLRVRLTSGAATLRAVRAVEVRYPFDRAASFACSDPFLDRLWSICARSLELLSEDSYVDCADRERVEWTDNTPPAFDCTRVTMRGPDADGKPFWGDNRLLKALLRRIALTQQPDGQMKAHSCSERWDIHAIMEDRSCDWVIQLRAYYESSDDAALVKELWPALVRLLQWFLDRRTQRGLVQAREWEMWDNPLRYQVCEGAGLNALVYRALADAAYLAGRIGETGAAARFEAEAGKLRADFNALLWNTAEGAYDSGLFGPGSKLAAQMNGRVFPGPIVDGRYKPTVQAALLALYCGIVPAERVDAVRRWVLAHLDDLKGIMSYYFLFDALYAMQEAPRDADALHAMQNGWKDQVECPWQTTWEALHGGSKAHIYGMVPGYYLTAFVLGARRQGPVAEGKILIEPRCGDLEWARGTAVTEFGPVAMEWQRSSNGAVRLKFTTPAGTSTTVRLYHQAGQNSMTVNGVSTEGKISGATIEISLPPGSHSVAYPA